MLLHLMDDFFEVVLDDPDALSLERSCILLSKWIPVSTGISRFHDSSLCPLINQTETGHYIGELVILPRFHTFLEGFHDSTSLLERPYAL